MTETERLELVEAMHNIWPTFPWTPGVDAEWHATFDPLPLDVADQVIDEFRKQSDWPPKHRQFVTAVQRIRRLQASTRALPEAPPDVCDLCDDTGWREAINPEGVSEVSPCKCSAGLKSRPQEGSHASDCSCHRCYYGVRQPTVGRTSVQRTDPEAAQANFAMLRAQLRKGGR